MTTEPLLPCPFCGQVPTDIRETDGSKWGAVVCCIVGPEVRTGYQPVEKWRDAAIAEWNRRTPSDASLREAALDEAAQLIRALTSPQAVGKQAGPEQSGVEVGSDDAGSQGRDRTAEHSGTDTDRSPAQSAPAPLEQRVTELEARVAHLEGRDRARGLSGMVIGGPKR